jgi:hypothetical protein
MQSAICYLPSGLDPTMQAGGSCADISNQPKLEADIKATFAEALRRRKPGEAKVELQRYTDVDKGQGRIEQRTCVLSRDLSGIENAAPWKGLAGLAMAAREVEDLTTHKVSKEIAYFIYSGQATTARGLLTTNRNHWNMESMHWTIDVTFGEDAHRIINRNGAANLSRIRRIAHGMVKNTTGWGMSMPRVRKRCGWNPDLILKVLAGEVIERQRKRRVLERTRNKPMKTK